MNIMDRLHKVYKKIDLFLEVDYEGKVVTDFINNMKLSKEHIILDVGCGYGKNILLLMEKTKVKRIIGIDINEKIIEKNKIKGMECYSLKEFEKLNLEYDCIIFSHVIEHFSPDELKSFLEKYLIRLKRKGYILISTPLLWKGFYWDFDHVKPYHPIGINMVFCNQDSQVQYYSDYKMNLLDIWFRKTPYIVENKRSLYIKNPLRYFWILVSLFYKFIFKYSGGRIGETNGWVGIYRKC